MVDSGDDLKLDEVLELPEAKQLIAAWGVKHEVAPLGHGGKVAPWLRAAMLRRCLGDHDP